MTAARIALVLALMGLIGASPARADVTIGSTLTAAPDTPAGCGAVCTVTQDSVTALEDGVITRWRVRTGTSTTSMRLQVLRGETQVGTSQLVAPAAGRINLFTTRVAIQMGDAIALACCESNPPMIVAAGAGMGKVFDPVLPSAAMAEPFTGELPLNADIEPDGDHDGYGDETQDNCPGTNDQADLDHDGQGDDCDLDVDGDGVPAGADPCPRIPGPELGCPEMPPRAVAPNKPPTARFRTPTSGSGVGPSVRIMLDAADDRGAPTVSVFDDDGTICVLRRAPYACTWTPTGADVGRATLVASAVDAAGLSSLAIVRVRVNRFAATLPKPKAKRRKGRRLRVSGRIVLPSVVTRAQGCSGNVTVRVRKVRKTVALSRRCTYAATLRVRTGRPRVSFAGNSVIAPST
jgi:hypothetical protein